MVPLYEENNMEVMHNKKWRKDHSWRLKQNLLWSCVIVCGIFHPQSYQSYECCQDCCQRLLCQDVLLLLEKQINVGIEVSFPLCSHQANESWLSYVQCLLDLNEVGSWRVHVGDSMLSSVWSRRMCRKENKWTFLIFKAKYDSIE